MKTPVSITTGQPIEVPTPDAPDIQPAFPDYNRKCLADALHLLRVRIRYDLRGDRPQYRKEGGSWRDLSDRRTQHLRDTLATRFHKTTTRGPVPFRFSADKWAIAFGALLCEHETDPFRDWLESLRRWDRVERIEHLLSDMFGAADTALTRWASAYLFRGPVHRAYKPGAKLDQMPVLIGGQGLGKSHLLAAILPERHRGRWFNDAINLKADTHRLAEAMAGRVIVEASELAGLYRAEVEALKAFLSRTDDGGVRLAYRRDPEPMPRRAIIVGTTNDESCLPNDPTGLRRFVPVRLAHGCDVAAHISPAVLPMLWAEALAWWRSGGVSASLPRDLIPDAAKAAERHRSSDELYEQRIADLKLTDPTLHEIMAGIGADPRESKRVTAALRNAGWEQMQSRRNGVKRRWWKCPTSHHVPPNARRV